MENAYIAHTIKSLCSAKGITISTLLADCCLTKSFIYYLEKRSASPSCDKIAKIVDYFQVPIDYLVGTGIYGQIARDPEIKPVIASEMDRIIGTELLKNMGIQSTAELSDASFGEIASLLVQSASYDKQSHQATIVLKSFFVPADNPEINK